MKQRTGSADVSQRKGEVVQIERNGKWKLDSKQFEYVILHMISIFMLYFWEWMSKVPLERK